MSKDNPKKRPPFPKGFGMYKLTPAGYRKIPEPLAGRYLELRYQVELFEKQCLPLLEERPNEALRGLIAASRSLGYVEALVGDNQTAEAQLVLERLRRSASKGSEARRKKAAPAHREIRKQFKSMRRAVPKKTARYLRLAEQFGMSSRQVSRIVEGLD